MRIIIVDKKVRILMPIEISNLDEDVDIEGIGVHGRTFMQRAVGIYEAIFEGYNSRVNYAK